METLLLKTVEQFILNINQQLLQAYGSFEPVLNTDLIDIDVMPMDNSRSDEQGVSPTYINLAALYLECLQIRMKLEA